MIFHWAIWLFFMILQVSLMWLYRVILPHSASFPAPGQSHNGDRCAVWTMPFGSGFCCLLGPSMETKESLAHPPISLSPYRSWHPKLQKKISKHNVYTTLSFFQLGQQRRCSTSANKNTLAHLTLVWLSSRHISSHDPCDLDTSFARVSNERSFGQSP